MPAAWSTWPATWNRSASEMSAARHYAIVTAAYWGFTLTDGALRMLVLLHFYRLGYSSVTLAYLHQRMLVFGKLLRMVRMILLIHKYQYQFY